MNTKELAAKIFVKTWNHFDQNKCAKNSTKCINEIESLLEAEFTERGNQAIQDKQKWMAMTPWIDKAKADAYEEGLKAGKREAFEQCAKIADEQAVGCCGQDGDYDSGVIDGSAAIARNIRQRAEEIK